MGSHIKSFFEAIIFSLKLESSPSHNRIIGIIVITNEIVALRKVLLKVHNKTNVIKIHKVLNVNSPLICNANALNIKSIKYINNNKDPKLTIKIAITLKKLIKFF